MRTHLLLVLAMALVITMATSVSMLLVRNTLRSQVTADLARDLQHSVAAFQELQAVRLQALDGENALLADLPSLKALMTSGDEPTIRDGGVEFWRISGNDLFALADRHSRVLAAYKATQPASRDFNGELEVLLAAPQKHFLVHGTELYACSVRPLYFGAEPTGTLLGYVISGVSIERTVGQISRPTEVEASFLSTGRVLASTLTPANQQQLTASQLARQGSTPDAQTIRLGRTRFLGATKDLTSVATAPLDLVVLKPLEPSERWIARIDRLLLAAGFAALLLGTTLMIAFSRLLTRPLEELSAGVRAFSSGDESHQLPTGGPREVRQLSKHFAGMRAEIHQAHQALLESERLATIGRMARSVSHDLRHYLAAVYANAEFLASEALSAEERAEIFAEIRTAVDGTTEMIESLLIFSRTGNVRHTPEMMSALLDRAAALVLAHPDAEGISLSLQCDQPAQTRVMVEGKQVERAIYNLLLNACQSARTTGAARCVSATVKRENGYVLLLVVDDGAGVSDLLRSSLFEPFVSSGKQKGSGLGLTLARTVAKEHGGDLVLQSSRAGETVFRMSLPFAEFQPEIRALASSSAEPISTVSTV